MKLAAGLLLMLIAAPVAEVRYLRYERPLQTEGAAGQACAVVDATMYAHAAMGLGDVRLYNGADETPYVIRDAAPVSEPQTPIALLNVGRRGGHTVFDAVMPDGTYGDLELAVTGKDFLAMVTVLGGASASDAKARIGEYTVFDFAGQRLGRSTVLHLPASNFRYLHFEVTGELLPGQFMQLTANRAGIREPQFVPVAADVTWHAKGRDTVAEFTVPEHVPVARLLFAAPAEPRNFSRDVTVEVAEDAAKMAQQAAMPEVASGNLLRLHSERGETRIDEERVFVDAPRMTFGRATHWTVTVHNGDDAAVRFTGLRVLMPEQKLCFEAAAGASYMLRYGDAALNAPSYDYARWFAPRADAAVAALGPEQANAIWEPRPDQRAYTERHPVLLWAALVAMVALLGAVAVRTARQLKTGE
ncbi:MAG TPA: DUF3999 family protein [Terracidiphilus sp.]|nr:DUF3999 family protein [Terracidiphilus sp.]